MTADVALSFVRAPFSRLRWFLASRLTPFTAHGFLCVVGNDMVVVHVAAMSERRWRRTSMFKEPEWAVGRNRGVVTCLQLESALAPGALTPCPGAPWRWLDEA